jgi:hypothetical protein
LDGRLGVTVNGTARSWSPVSDGDELSVGRVRMRARYVDNEFAAAADGNGLASLANGIEGLPDDIITPILSQFSALQRQMFDQFQQAIYMMVEMFKKMEREQTELIRREVDRIHGITEELRLLQLELGHHRSRLPRRSNRPGRRRSAVVGAGRQPDARPAGDTACVTGEPPVSTEAEKEMQKWLYKQISTLQRERESRLQKLVNFLSGQGHR